MSLAHTLQSVRSIVLALAVIVCGLAGRVDAQQTGSYRTSSPSSERVVEVLSHDLNVELHPNRHQLDVLDRMTFKALVSSPASLSFVLNDALQVADIRLVNDKGAPLAITTRSEARIPRNQPSASQSRWTIPLLRVMCSFWNGPTTA